MRGSPRPLDATPEWGTFAGYRAAAHPGSPHRLDRGLTGDHVAASGDQRAQVDHGWPSDHLPVQAVVRVPSPHVIENFLRRPQGAAEWIADAVRVLGLVSVLVAGIGWSPVGCRHPRVRPAGAADAAVPRHTRWFDICYGAVILVAAWSNVLGAVRRGRVVGPAGALPVHRSDRRDAVPHARDAPGGASSARGAPGRRAPRS